MHKTFVAMGMGSIMAALVGCAADTTTAEDADERTGVTAQAATVLEASFSDCTELVAYLDVPAANARSWVPERFTLGVFATQNDPTDLTQLAVRISSCKAVTVGKDTRPTVYTQIGIVIESPDGTGHANAYQLAFLSDNPHLVNLVKSEGVTEAVVNHEDISYTAGDPGERLVSAFVSRPYKSPLTATAVSPVPEIPFDGFVANWWEQTSSLVRLQNVLPNVLLGFCSGSMTFAEGSELAQIVGSTTKQIDFCLHNDYAASTRTVTTQD